MPRYDDSAAASYTFRRLQSITSGSLATGGCRLPPSHSHDDPNLLKKYAGPLCSGVELTWPGGHRWPSVQSYARRVTTAGHKGLQCTCNAHKLATPTTKLPRLGRNHDAVSTKCVCVGTTFTCGLPPGFRLSTARS